MNRRSISDDFPKHFQRQALSLVSRVVPLTSCGFYLVGDEVTNRWVVFRNLNEDLEQVYRDKFLAHDPLNPALFDGTDTRVACIDEQLPEAELLDSLYYREFMAPLKHRHVADMFFRYGRDIIAVMTMIREAGLGPFQPGELTLLRDLQPFLEYTLNTVYLPRRYRQRDTVQQLYKLSDRELEVVELILGGASNKEIARALDLGLATVKTHVQHIFQKVDVPSRTALSARIQDDLNA
jgi:DNA-binding CsgD family transcriptional regulator